MREGCCEAEHAIRTGQHQPVGGGHAKLRAGSRSVSGSFLCSMRVSGTPTAPCPSGCPAAAHPQAPGPATRCGATAGCWRSGRRSQGPPPGLRPARGDIRAFALRQDMQHALHHLRIVHRAGLELQHARGTGPSTSRPPPTSAAVPAFGAQQADLFPATAATRPAGLCQAWAPCQRKAGRGRHQHATLPRRSCLTTGGQARIARPSSSGLGRCSHPRSRPGPGCTHPQLAARVLGQGRDGPGATRVRARLGRKMPGLGIPAEPLPEPPAPHRQAFRAAPAPRRRCGGPAKAVA